MSQQGLDRNLAKKNEKRKNSRKFVYILAKQCRPHFDLTIFFRVDLRFSLKLVVFFSIADTKTWSSSAEDGQIFPPTPPATPPSTSSDSGYPCDFCPKVYPSKSKLAEHINFRHSEARPHQCSHCSKVFKSNSNLKQHIRCAHERPRFPCPDCPDSSAAGGGQSAKVFSESGLRYHRLTAHSAAGQTQRHPCQVCGRTFLQATLLRKHMTSAHVGERKFSCPYCPATFKRKDHADRHITDTHSLVRELFECEDCGGRFQSASRLKQHAKLHHDENVRKPCQFCGKKMLVKNLMTHFHRVHYSSSSQVDLLAKHHQTDAVIQKLNSKDSSYC